MLVCMCVCVCVQVQHCGNRFILGQLNNSQLQLGCKEGSITSAGKKQGLNNTYLSLCIQYAQAQIQSNNLYSRNFEARLAFNLLYIFIEYFRIFIAFSQLEIYLSEQDNFSNLQFTHVLEYYFRDSVVLSYNVKARSVYILIQL